MSKALVIDDEAPLTALIGRFLEGAGFTVESATCGIEGVRKAAATRPDLIIVDIMMPDIDGYEVCRRLRADPRSARAAIVVLTARAAESDRILGLEAGADDYVTKPFSPRELVARVRAVLRRAQAREPVQRPHEVYEKGRLRVDFDAYEVRVDGRQVDLSLREFELLRFFVRAPHRTFDRLQILDLVWGPDTYVEPRTVDVHIRRLRKHIERDDANPELIRTVRGVGYRFDDRGLEA